MNVLPSPFIHRKGLAAPSVAPPPFLRSIVQPPQPKETAHSFGCLMAPMPDDLAAELLGWAKANIPADHLAEDGYEDHPHVTVKYGFVDDSPAVLGALRMLLALHGPLPIRLTNFSLFENESHVLKIDVESRALHELNAWVKDSFDCSGDRFPDYKPHITLAYLKPEVSREYTARKAPFLNSEVVLTECEFGDKDGKSTFLPLSVMYDFKTLKRKSSHYFTDNGRRVKAAQDDGMRDPKTGELRKAMSKSGEGWSPPANLPEHARKPPKPVTDDSVPGSPPAAPRQIDHTDTYTPDPTDTSRTHTISGDSAANAIWNYSRNDRARYLTSRGKILPSAFNSVPYRGKSIHFKGVGTCEVGQRADLTGCIPASGDPSTKPSQPKQEAAKQRPGFAFVVRGKDGAYTSSDGKPLSVEVQGRLKELRLPPAWTNVQLSTDSKAALQAVGKDAKGRDQYVYSAEHSAWAAADKFARVKSFVSKLPSLTKQVRSDLELLGRSQEFQGKKKEQAERIGQNAAVLLLMRKTGFRIGSEEDRQTEHEALGATTLKSDNVKIEGDRVVFDFVGKKGVKIHQEVEDRELAAVIKGRLKTAAKRGGKLFDTNEVSVRDYLQRVVGDFKPKDIRTVVAAETALMAIAGISQPKDEKEFAKARAEVGKQVAAKLGNTSSVALASYIPPEVFTAWKSGLEVERGRKS